MAGEGGLSAGVVERFDDTIGIEHAWRYVVATVPITLAGQLLLYQLHAGFGLGAVLANLLAFTALVGPQYALNRFWVWSSRERGGLRLEVALFWVIGATGLLVSTGMVAVAERHLHDPLWVNAASLAGFGVVWLARFFVLDRLLFAERGRG